MGIRKFKADRVFDGFRFLEPGTVVITDSQGTIAGLVPAAAAGDDTEPLPGILLPGLINAHCHLELSHLAGTIPENTGMVPFLLSVMKNRFYADDIIQQAMTDADAYMVAHGIVAVGDTCNTTHSVEVKKSSRIRYVNFLETSGFIPSTAPARYEQVRNMLARFAEAGPAYLVPHAPYSVSPELFRLLPADAVCSMHNQESAEENEFFLSGTGPFTELFRQIGADISFWTPSGKSSLQAVIPHLPPAARLILVHNVETTTDDLRELQQLMPLTQPYLCFCPRANQYINGQLPSPDLLLPSGIPMVMGTDSLASNHSLNLMEELLVLQDHFPELPLEQVLAWVTSAGAAALGLDQEFGQLTKGRKPGLVLLSGRDVKRVI